MVIFTRIQIVTPALVFLLLLHIGAARAQQATALDQYVAAADPSYNFRLVRSAAGIGYTVHILEMTSQTWRNSAEVNQPAWRHWLRVVVPSRLQTSTGFLLINGGTSQEEAPSAENVDIAPIAALVGAVAAEIRTVPNQPLVFTGQPQPLSEDALIAYTWDKYLRTGDERWPVQLPMTKAVVRAMDTVISFCATAQGGNVTVDKFVIAGGSKRGYAAWLTAAVDRRVVGLIPVVIDLLNMEESFGHHWRSYGAWAPAVRDYEQAGIFTWLRTSQIAALRAIVDPYVYRARLTMPKYIVNASGDEFFAPDSSRFYFDDLPGDKYLRYVPNSSHDIDIPDVLTGAVVFFQSVIGASPQRRFSWEFPPEGGIRVRTADRPAEVKLWQATNPAARDFRLQTIGRTWASTTLTESSPGVYEARVTAPPAGWSAYFLELTYSTGGLLGLAVKFTTPVRIVSDTLPFAAPLITLSAANYLPITAPDSFVSAFGQNLATSTEPATSVPLPTTLGGVSVNIKDSGGNSRAAPLFYASPGQVNYLIPPGTASGVANVDVVRNGQVIVKGQTLVENIAPGLFSADSTGRGIAAGLAITARADGSIQTVPLSSQTPVSLGASGDQVYLSLFGTGMRNASGSTALVPAAATIGGEPVAVNGPVAQPQFPGVDQVNLGPLPRSLAGRGEVSILLALGAKTANAVTVRIQ